MTQRPELFGACLPTVGVMDMLRFHQFTAGQFWRDDYGIGRRSRRSSRPCWPIRPITTSRRASQYPATLIMTADTDDRVVPMHSFKFAAALQRAQAGDAPILMRIETRAGHGARHAVVEADRKRRRPLGVPGEEPRDGRAGEGLTGAGSREPTRPFDVAQGRPSANFGSFERLRETRFTAPKLTRFVTRRWPAPLENQVELPTTGSKTRRIRAAWIKFQNSTRASFDPGRR